MRSLVGLVMLLVIVSSFTCAKNLTDYYADPTDTTLAIFSDRGYNLMTCLVNSKPWKTKDRNVYPFGPVRYEILITNDTNDPLSDSLHFNWTGGFANDNLQGDNIELVIPVKKGFRAADLRDLQGQRFNLDGKNGYVKATLNTLGQQLQGTGHIYFNKFTYDLTFATESIMAGLLDAKFTGFTLESGRFDHSLSSLVVTFP